jgi:hypothetical protein
MKIVVNPLIPMPNNQIKIQVNPMICNLFNSLRSHNKRAANPKQCRTAQKIIEYKGQKITTMFQLTKSSTRRTTLTMRIVMKYLKKLIRVSRFSSSSSS